MSDVLQVIRTQNTPECTCSFVSSGTYEGPQPWCNAHSTASEAYVQGILEGRKQALEIVQAATRDL